MNIPQSYLHEKYSIPVPEEGEPVARRSATAAAADAEGAAETITNADRSLLARLRGFSREPRRAGRRMGMPSSD